MAEPKIKKKKITDYKQDGRNFNKGSESGNALINKSISKLGVGRSMLAASDGTLIAGNKTQEQLVALGIENVIEVETDGNTAVVVKRTDIKSGSKHFHELALADNQTSKINYVEDVEVMEAVAEEVGIDLEEWMVKAKTALENTEDSPEATSQWSLLIELESERECEKMFNELQNKGYKVKIIT